MSREPLDFLAKMGTECKFLRPIFANRERYCRDSHGFELNYAAGYWTPPLPPHPAYNLERRQIEDRLQLPALVSITDHDDIRAPIFLRSVPRVPQIPISVEWTVPYRDSVFHLGVHNLPAPTSNEWMHTFAAFTAAPSAPRLKDILSQLDALPNVLIVFNHPVWDLYKVGAERHLFCINEFMSNCSHFIHAIELNGLRGWPENRSAMALAQEWGRLLISGGDRHGAKQPNANINLTNAASFDEFVHEVRNEGTSHVLFMPQYAEPWKHRVLQAAIDVIGYYPDFPEGTRHWDDRVYHPDANGIIRPISQLWPGDGRAPALVRCVLGATRLLGKGPFSRTLRLAWSDPHGLRMTLNNQDA